MIQSNRWYEVMHIGNLPSILKCLPKAFKVLRTEMSDIISQLEEAKVMLDELISQADYDKNQSRSSAQTPLLQSPKTTPYYCHGVLVVW